MLVSNGKSTFVIALAGDAIPAEKTAATELQQYVHQISGAVLPIKSEADVDANRPQILVGSGARVKVLLPDIHWDQLSSDTIVLKTVGNKLILAGGRPRGSLYAVLIFLEQQLGVRWWTPKESTVPRSSTINVPELNTVYTPQIKTREVFSSSMWYPDFATYLKNNGDNQRQNAAWGGHNITIGSPHTFFEFLPPSQYFARHPDWYGNPADDDKPFTAAGTKLPGQYDSQLNIMNPEVRAAMISAIKAKLAANPDAKVVRVSQNDNQHWCNTPEQNSLAAAQGSAAGPLIDFVNAVADGIKKDYPDVTVETLAYKTSLIAPATLKPHENVRVRICLQGDATHPIQSTFNAESQSIVNGWHKLNANLAIWEYTAAHGLYIYPFPTWRTMGANIKYFADNNVSSAFLQSDYYSKGAGDFCALRDWVMSQLMWNPSLKEDDLVSEFLWGYYGPAAAPYLKRYIDLVQDSFLATHQSISGVVMNPALPPANSYLTYDFFTKAFSLFGQAQAAVSNDPVLSLRLRRARLALAYAWVLRYPELYTNAAKAPNAFPNANNIVAFLNDLIKDAQDTGAGDIRENWNKNVMLATYLQRMRDLYIPSTVPLPAEIKSTLPAEITPDDIVDAHVDQLELFDSHWDGNWVEKVSDPAASNGYAAKTTKNKGYSGWTIQLPLNTLKIKSSNRWRCYVVAKADITGTATSNWQAFSTGIVRAKPDRSSVIVDATTVADGKYHVIDLGTYTIDNFTRVWVMPNANDKVAAVYVDRIILVRQP